MLFVCDIEVHHVDLATTNMMQINFYIIYVFSVNQVIIMIMRGVTADILARQVLLNRVPEQATEDRVRYQIYY